MPSLDTENPTEDQIQPEEDENPAEKTLSGPIIGIIYPPPEVRSILNLKTKKKQTQLFCLFHTFIIILH